MPFSAGQYSLPAGNPVVTATAISSTWANNTMSDISTALSTCVLKDGTQVITANLPMAGFKFTGLGAGSAAGQSVRWEQSAPGVVTTKGDTVVATAAGAIGRLGVGSNGQTIIADSAQFTTNGIGWGVPALRSYLAGLTLSTAGASTTITTAAGQAADGGNTTIMTLASAIGKTTSAWAVGTGNGGLDTGAIANSTWYHLWLIMRPDTSVVDVLISLSATAPTMPANYTLKRRIGSGLTTGGGNWTLFQQDGDYFQLDVSVNNVATTNPGTAAVTATLTTPLGINVFARIFGRIGNVTTGNISLNISDLGQTDTAPDGSANTSLTAGAAGGNAAGEFIIRTNTSSQIRYRLSTSGAADVVWIGTRGWYDRRGKDS